MKTAAPASEVITLYHSRRHASTRARGLSHLFPALVLVTGALGALVGDEPFTLLTGLELAIGAAYALLLRQELRHLKHHPHEHPKVAWLEIAAAGILALEGYHIAHRHHEHEAALGVHRFHLLPWLYAVLAVVYLSLAFGMRHLLERRYLQLSSAGFAGRLSVWGAEFSYAWAELERLTADGPADVLVHCPNQPPVRLSLAKTYHGAAHRDRLLAYAAQQGVVVEQ